MLNLIIMEAVVVLIIEFFLYKLIGKTKKAS